MKFTEGKLEQAFADLLGLEGYSHHLGNNINRMPEEVLIEDDLRKFLSNKYALQGISISEINSIILQLKSLSATDHYESNKTFLKMLSDGFILKRDRPAVNPQKLINHGGHVLRRNRPVHDIFSTRA